MLSSKKISSDLPWKLLTIEAVLVVLSVLLALALSSWLQSRSDQVLAQRGLQEFMGEIHTNCARITTAHAYHEAVASGASEPRGIQVGLLRNDAWDFAKTTGAAQHLEHDVVAKLVEINAYQSDHRTVVQAYLQALFNIGLQLEKEEKWHQEGERGVISELVRIQSDLLEQYHGLLALVDEHYQGSIETRNVCGKS